MAIFGYNAIGVNSLGLSDDNLFVNAAPARIAMRGNPVLGGNMVSAHVYALQTVAQNAPTWQIGVYDATCGVPANYTLLAISTPFVLPVGSPAQWFVTPIAGALIAGNSYCAAVLELVDGAARGSVFSDPIPLEAAVRAFIGPGVFPDPLGVVNNATHEWSLFITYERDVSQYSSSVSCCPNGD